MNRIVSFLFLMLYFTFSTGMVVSKHFCMNEPVAVSLQQMDSHQACAKCGMESKAGCCHDEVSIIKLTDSHASVNASINLKAPQIIALQFWMHNNIERFLTNQTIQCQYLPPLFQSKSDTQALISVFRI